jgi:drug/metabolite transporter (DMT)-like permease
MEWLFLVLAAVAMFGMLGALQRYILREEDPLSYAFWFNSLATFFFLPLLLLEPLVLPSTLPQLGLFFAAAIMWFCINVVSFYATAAEHVTLVNPLRQTNVLWVLVFAVFLLREELTMFKLFGTLSILAGVVALTWKGGLLKGLDSVGARLALVLAVMMAFVTVLDKYNVSSGVSPAFYGLSMFALPGAAFLLIAGFRRARLRKTLFSKRWAILAATGLLALGYYVILHAYRIADVSVINPITRLDLLITMALGYVWLQEREEFGRRLLGAVLMIAGAFLVAAA